MTDPALLPRLFKLSGKVRTLESLRVLTLPDVRVALWIELEIEPALLLENSRKPRIVAPVRLHNDECSTNAFERWQTSCRLVLQADLRRAFTTADVPPIEAENCSEM
jgi:hypothetical protein